MHTTSRIADAENGQPTVDIEDVKDIILLAATNSLLGTQASQGSSLAASIGCVHGRFLESPTFFQQQTGLRTPVKPVPKTGHSSDFAALQKKSERTGVPIDCYLPSEGLGGMSCSEASRYKPCEELVQSDGSDCYHCGCVCSPEATGNMATRCLHPCTVRPRIE